MVLSVVSTLLSLKTQHTEFTMVEWCITTMVLPNCNESTTNTQQRQGKHQCMNHNKKDKETKEWRVWLFFLPKTPLFTLQSLSWQSLHSHNHISLLWVVIPCVEKPTQVWWVCRFWESPDDGCLDGVDGPQSATSQPHHPPGMLYCFSLLVFSIHIHITQMVFMWWSLQWCAQPFNQWHVPSTSLSNTITL